MGGIFGIAILLFLLIWVISGISAFIMSLVCFGYKGSAGEKFIGLLLSVFFGPFYWIYYAVNGSYCLSN